MTTVVEESVKDSLTMSSLVVTTEAQKRFFHGMHEPHSQLRGHFSSRLSQRFTCCAIVGVADEVLDISLADGQGN